MALPEQIDRELVQALKAGDRTTVATLRLLKAAAKNVEVEKRRPLTDEEYLDVVRRQVKLRREAATEYDRAGRAESADQERAELAILDRYLPAQLDDDAITSILQEAISATSASSPRDLGKVMARAMPALRGKADGSRVQQIARTLLQPAS